MLLLVVVAIIKDTLCFVMLLLLLLQREDDAGGGGNGGASNGWVMESIDAGSIARSGWRQVWRTDLRRSAWRWGSALVAANTWLLVDLRHQQLR